jgi:hypothetical protein
MEANEKIHSIFPSTLKTGAMPPMQAMYGERHSMSHALHPVLQIVIALLSLGILIGPKLSVDEEDLDANDFDRTHIP